METSDTNKPSRNFVQRIVDQQLDNRTHERIREYTRDYATREDGGRDDEMAFVIKREVLRRGKMGRELDVYEPIRWTLASFILASIGGMGLKMAMKEKVDSNIMKTILQQPPSAAQSTSSVCSRALMRVCAAGWILHFRW